LKQAHVQTLEQRLLFAYDLVLESVSLQAVGGTLQAGTALSATAVVRNAGDTASPDVGVYYALTRTRPVSGKPLEPASVLARTVVGPLGPGESREVQLSLPTVAGLARRSYFLTALASDRIVLPKPGDPIPFSRRDPTPVDNLRATESTVLVVAPARSIGRPDGRFGGGGVASNVLSGPRLFVQKTVFDPVGGFQYAAANRSTSGVDNVALIRLDANGQLDRTYGVDGVQLVTGLPPGRVVGFARHPDGSLYVLAVLQNFDRAIIRYTGQGVPDVTFGSNGFVTVPAIEVEQLGFDSNSPVTLLAGPNGSVYVVGTNVVGTIRKIGVVQVTAAGIDRSFGLNGLARVNTASTNGDTARAAMLAGDGRIIVAGLSKSSAAVQAIVVALTPQGQADNTFGTAGVALLASIGGYESYITVGAGPGSSILLGGVSRSRDATSSSVLVVRLTSAGKPDRFGKSGVATVALGGTTPFAAAASLKATPDGGVLVSARTAVSATAIQRGLTGITLVRLTAAGALLPQFGTGGKLEVSPAPLPPASAASNADFDSFVNSADGALEDVGNGRLRLFAGDTSVAGQTTFTATQLVTDGVDLIASSTTKLPVAALVGRSGTLKVDVSNLGTLASEGTATFTVRMLASEDDTTGTVAATSSLTLRLAPGSTRKLSLKFLWPDVGGIRGQFVACDVSTSTTQSDIDPDNNRAQVEGACVVGPAFTDLSFGFVEPLPAIVAGTRPSIRLSISNLGNTTASGAALLRFLLAEGATTDPAMLAELTSRLSIPAGATRTVTVRPTLPTGVLSSGRLLGLSVSGAFTSLDRDPENTIFSTSAVT
jgi:uncharacterized delta-60 repeat protein